MANAAQLHPPQAFSSIDPAAYLSREASWLEFNRRVLQEAMDPRTPLLEALKFLTIFSDNLDEYFMVRVAAIKQQIGAQVAVKSPDGRTPSQQLQLIHRTLRPMVQQQQRFFGRSLRTRMAENGIYLLNYRQLNPTQQRYLAHYFEDHLFPVLTPLAVEPGHPFPYLSNLSLNLAVVLEDSHTHATHIARVKVPRVLPRFIALPEELWSKRRQPCQWIGVPLEQVIIHHLESLFPGMILQGHALSRITRDADLAVVEDETDDLMLAIEQELQKRRLGGSAVRLEIQRRSPPQVQALMVEELGLSPVDVYAVDGLLGLGDLSALASLPCPALKAPAWLPTVPPALATLNPPQVNEADDDLEDAEDLFALVRRQNQLFHHPYHAFAATVQRFISQAAHDPHVLAIKITLYRTSGDSPIVNALIAAAANGKQVTALVELKARFDEENNINWAKKLEQSGVHVVYGLMGLKIHTKMTLVVRREGDHLRRYFHLSTGNYNPKTARYYTDLGLLSACPEIGADLSDLFNYLTGYSRQHQFRQLLVAPLTLRQQLVALIHDEIQQVRHGKPGRIIVKMNAFTDPDLIQLLYQASQAGVVIDLIIRGICCLRPGLPGFSDNIRVISILGQFLEHSRIFYFHNGGDERFFMGSADWRPRNLDRRVEAVVPITDPAIRAELRFILDAYLQDNRQAWDMNADGTYTQRQPPSPEAVFSAQAMLMARASHADPGTGHRHR
ncbi:RNA degradosome polyphosphate kinase [Leptolyngbya sp. BL0902]|uniref:polyphosphate kinase 1 n=1 Tax=Leptolyngbya sp. BL0902 TaxID=1115757 RepID=UPI0018E84AF4|nr:polyphosphate kinase 1 [Leptolyngbya sp. BL0902]QQE66485.1 RNA degradosome polyphosphate kinase [Leptolyngbya sp. BL0902]